MAYIPKILRESGYINPNSRIPMSDQVKIIELYCDKAKELSMQKVAMELGISKASVQQWLKRAEDCAIINYATREKIYETDLANVKFTKREEARIKARLAKEAKRKQENKAMSSKFEQFVDAALDELNERDLSNEKTTDLVKAAGTAVDKMRLLRDESTKNVMKERKSIVEIWSQVDAIPLEDQLKMLGESEPIVEAEVVESDGSEASATSNEVDSEAVDNDK